MVNGRPGVAAMNVKHFGGLFFDLRVCRHRRTSPSGGGVGVGIAMRTHLDLRSKFAYRRVMMSANRVDAAPFGQAGLSSRRCSAAAG
jgi:hypothetical protein